MESKGAAKATDKVMDKSYARWDNFDDEEIAPEGMAAAVVGGEEETEEDSSSNWFLATITSDSEANTCVKVRSLLVHSKK